MSSEKAALTSGPSANPTPASTPDETAWPVYGRATGEQIYHARMRPYRGGLLSFDALRDRRLSKKRLMAHVRALEGVAWWLAHDLASAQSWGVENSKRIDHCRDRCTQLWEAARALEDVLLEQNVDPDLWAEIVQSVPGLKYPGGVVATEKR